MRVGSMIDPDLEPEAGWRLAVSPPGAWGTPAEARHADAWHPAVVPGTAAAALERAGLWDRRHPAALHDRDIWYAATLQGSGPVTLVFEGLATIAEVWLDDALVARSDSMFIPLAVDVRLDGAHHLAMAFRSLSAHLAGRTAPRARWRTRMVDDPKLRLVRTTMLGHAPGWCPSVHAVGPWRPVRLLQPSTPRLQEMRSSVEGDAGVLTVAVALPGCDGGEPVHLMADEYATPLRRGGDGLWRGTLRIPGVERWWPRTHGAPRLYDIRLAAGDSTVRLGGTGFRTLSVDRGQDGREFHLHVNGTRIFCRGACWTPDVVALDDGREALEPLLRRLADAHVNMLRVGGTMVYEGKAFHALCDELGILVWQDCMLANFDYPRDESFAASILAEVRALLRRTVASPSLAVICGGSEILQQATMMGLPPSAAAHPLFDDALPSLVAAERPDVVFVAGSPSGGALPFTADHGPSHYYGVGAYKRPLEDARRAEVRFASECLAFSNVPEDATLAAEGLDTVTAPEAWAAGVPRDNGADWTFEDTRHHYMALLGGIDPAALRATDLQRYLDLSRAVTAEVAERTFDEWRRPGSPTGGGLVWFARDLRAGAGWGIIDAVGRPKSNFYAMRRAFAPRRLFITDEGVNGLAIHIVNDGDAAITGRITLTCLRNGAQRVMAGTVDLLVPARSGVSTSAFTVFGCFFDAGCAYGFGAPPHDVVIAAWESGDALLAEAHWFPAHAKDVRHSAVPSVLVTPDRDGWLMTITAGRALRSVVIADETFVPEDNGFHLTPGRVKSVRLEGLAGHPSHPPRGEIRALDLDRPVSYG